MADAEAIEPTAEPTPKRPKLRAPRRVKVTKIERQAYDLRHSPKPSKPLMPWSQVARAMDRDARDVRRAYDRAARKIPLEDQFEVSPQSLGVKDPEKYTELVLELSHPDADKKAVAEIARRVDIPQSTAKQIAKSLRGTHLPAKMEIRNITIERLKGLWGTQAERCLEAMTDDKFEEASLYQLATAAGIATDKILLLRGLPTSIVRTEDDRVKLDVLAKALQVELDRRGYELESDSSTGIVDVTYTRAGEGRVESDA